jgi:hypothetical protein
LPSSPWPLSSAESLSFSIPVFGSRVAKLSTPPVAITRGQISGEEYAEMSAKLTKSELARTVREKAKDPLYKAYSDPEKAGLSIEI